MAEGKTAEQVKARLGMVLTPVPADNDPNWVDMEIDEEEQEALWRFDEREEGLQQSLRVDEEMKEDVKVRRESRGRMAIFRGWARHWLLVLKSVRRKMKVGPQAFNADKRLMWRVVAALDGEEGDEGWIELSGVAADWPDNFDYKSNGWDVPGDRGREAQMIINEIYGLEPSVRFDQIVEFLRSVLV